ncbi:flagellar hook assembly protein FlgD [Roseibium aggregatum]|uniref:Basal-body rod modification protein FlgD n=1 Tax=Roseibium aggregatum TaxID=187304 RepID=A0A926P1S9_9HYPH|nr:flagellar hook assembly protein FlgD [Roseibium aggregatum]MBD1545351.1 flagellar hook assembly protein FlgD [Roseibium aggregatum]
MTTVDSATAANSTSKSSAASDALLGNYDLFLSILTTQVQNQDPLNPMDSSEYTSQLVQYSSVEQSIQTNKYLEQLVSSMAANQASNYVNYLGSTVTASGSTAMLEDGNANWSYTLPENASGTVTIKNSNGATVYSGDVNLSKGSGTYSWDGVGSSGNAPDGAYTVSFDLKNAAGNSILAKTEVSGKVDEVDLSGETPYLKVGNVSIPVSSVKSVSS